MRTDLILLKRQETHSLCLAPPPLLFPPELGSMYLSAALRHREVITEEPVEIKEGQILISQ